MRESVSYAVLSQQMKNGSLPEQWKCGMICSMNTAGHAETKGSIVSENLQNTIERYYKASWCDTFLFKTDSRLEGEARPSEHFSTPGS
jgi:hypothetical protein